MNAHPQHKRDRAVEALLLGMNVAEAAKHAKMARRTLYLWLQTDQDFRRQLDQARQRVFELHICQLAELTGTGIRRLKQILDDDTAPPRDWLRAAELVMREARNSEGGQIMEEIRKLQDAVERRQT